MTAYKDNVNFVAHSFNTTTVLINDEHKVQGLHTIEVNFDEDEVETQAVASGMSIFVENPVTKGEIVISFLEASATTDYLWDLKDTGDQFAIAINDD